jgi:hypothetical protein
MNFAGNAEQRDGRDGPRDRTGSGRPDRTARRRKERWSRATASAVTSQFHIIQPHVVNRNAIAGPDVAVQLMFLQVLQQRAASAVDDALRDTGACRMNTDVKRMRERKAFTRQRRV